MLLLGVDGWKCWQSSLRGEEMMLNWTLGFISGNKTETLCIKKEEMSENLPRNMDYYSQEVTLQKQEAVSMIC